MRLLSARDSGLLGSQGDMISLMFTASAAGTVHTLIAPQRGAASKVWAVTGDGSIDLTSAIAQSIVKSESGAALSSEKSALATGLVTFFTNVPAAADGAKSVAFAVGGIGCAQVVWAQLTIMSRASTSAANPSRSLALEAGAKVITVPVVLDGSSRILDDAGSAIALSSDSLVAIPGHHVLFGGFTLTDVADAPASGDILRLDLIVKG